MYIAFCGMIAVEAQIWEATLLRYKSNAMMHFHEVNSWWLNVCEPPMPWWWTVGGSLSVGNKNNATKYFVGLKKS